MYGNAEVTAAVHGCDGNFNLSVADPGMSGEFSVSSSAIIQSVLIEDTILLWNTIPWGVFALSNAATMMDWEILKVVSSVDCR